MGGPSVNSAATGQEQQNQHMAEKYAATQQQQALAALQSYIKANPNPASSGASGPAIAPPPGAAAPGGAAAGAPPGQPPAGPPAQGGGAPTQMSGQPQAQPQAMGQKPPMQGQPQQQIPPQMRARLLAMLQGQAH